MRVGALVLVVLAMAAVAVNASTVLSTTADKLAREGAEEAAIFEEYWHKTHPGQEADVGLSTITTALRKRQLSLASIFEHAKSTLVSQSKSRLELREGECPRWDGKVCNGPKSGECGGTKCKCVGNWTGLACQTEPELKYYTAETAIAEPNKGCEGDVKGIQQAC